MFTNFEVLTAMNVSRFLAEHFPQGATVAAHATLSPRSWYEDGSVDSWGCSPFHEIEEIDGVTQMDDGDFFSEDLDCEIVDLARVALDASAPDCDRFIAYKDPCGDLARVACLNAASI